eukprot:COSAG02_NODE_952_length_15692_cov_7.587764_12_plen_47_part_00
MLTEIEVLVGLEELCRKLWLFLRHSKLVERIPKPSMNHACVRVPEL